MEIGLIIPEGYFNEFEGWDPVRAAARALEISETAERLGFNSLWTGEHTLAKWGGNEGNIFDCLTLSTAIAARVPRVEIGFLVVNSTFRNPAMTAKAAGTLDAISGGRVILGIGAGFKPTEAAAFGVPFPDLKERLAILSEHFEIVSRMTRWSEPPVTFVGEHARVEGVVNAPRTSGRDHIPLLIGGHGRNVTYRLAAKYCDEINIDATPDAMAEEIGWVDRRCEEIGRDSSTLLKAAGTNPAWPYRGLRVTGGQRMMTQEDLPAIMKADMSAIGTRADELIAYRELGIGRVVCGVPGLANTDEGLHELIEDAAAAGAPITPPVAGRAIEGTGR